MSNFPPELVVDTGPIIDFLCKTDLGLKFKEKIAENEEISRLYVSETAVSEIYYILCRQLGIESAEKLIKALLDSVEVAEGREIQILAGKYKCERKISLSDCFTLAAAKERGIPALFKKEAELSREIERREFDLEILLIEEDF